MYKLIAQLPEMDRIIISLELEEIKQAEIARITGLGESNIRVRIHRIKVKLHQEFLHHESIWFKQFMALQKSRPITR